VNFAGNTSEKSNTPKKDTGVFGAVSEGLKKITFSGKGKEHSIAHLTIMNLPPLAAKRDAAYEIAIAILEEKIESTSSGELLVAYTEALKLLNTSEKAHKEMIKAIAKAGKKNIVDAHGVYLRLFSDMLSSALFVLSSSAIICADEQTISYLLGNPKSEKTREMLDLFSQCEFDLRNSIADLYKKAHAAVEKEKGKMKKNFSAEDIERYTKSFQEFLRKFN